MYQTNCTEETKINAPEPNTKRYSNYGSANLDGEQGLICRSAPLLDAGPSTGANARSIVKGTGESDPVYGPDVDPIAVPQF